MESSDVAVTRRAVLTGTATGLTAGISGCQAIRGQSRSSQPVSVLSAGSLQLAFGEGLESETTVPLEIESHGSITAARMVSEGQRDPDIIALAEPALFDSVLHTSWYAEYASNAIVVAYNSNTEVGQRIATADRWYEPLRDKAATLGRTDPALDPLGYRTVFMLRLATDFYGHPDLADEILRDQQIYPETELLSHFETGALDAAIVYRNMAVERDYKYIELPDQINLSNPEYVDDWYSTVSSPITESRTVTGDVISYAATVREGKGNERTREVFKTLIHGDYLKEFGFRVPSTYPTYTDHVPDTITQ